MDKLPHKHWSCVLYSFYLFIQIQLGVSLEPKGNLPSLMLHCTYVETEAQRAYLTC